MLWSALQDHPIARFGFRRQERVGPFIIDIVCPGAKLAVLLEGGLPERDEWLGAAGYRVLTFTCTQASNPAVVLDDVASVLTLRAVR